MAQWMIVNETGDWNLLERTEKKSKGLFVVKNDKKDKVSLWEKWQKMTNSDTKRTKDMF